MPCAIIGYTGSGKSRMVREAILPAWRRKGVAALILDPVCQDWGAPAPWVWQTADPYAFLAKAQAARNCVLIVDECAVHVGASAKLARDLMWLPCTSRNNGHFLYLMGQRTLHLPPSYRSQCSEAYLFWQPAIDEAQEAAVMAGQPRSFGAAVSMMKLGTCYRCLPRQAPTLLRVF